MKRNILFAFVLIAALFHAKAQYKETIPRQRIAIFAPLFLDSAFEAGNNYRHGLNFPKYINPGLEFYEGAQLALDSLAKEKLPLEVFVFDTRSATKTIQQQLAEAAADSIQMIIAYTAMNEIQQFAYAAQKMKIPFINVNLPNDGGVYENPYFVMLNSTLKTHIESMYRYLQKFHPMDEILVFRKKGKIEDLVKTYFNDFGKSTLSVPLKLNFIELTDSFTLDQLTSRINSERNTICVAGTLDENFGSRLAIQLASVSMHYKVTLMGMPTFDNIEKEFSKPEYKDLDIIYSTPFYNPRKDSVSQSITNYFYTKMYARPSDMVLRGYEATWRFSKLLLQYKKDITSNLTRREFNLFREFDIQPVFNKQHMTLDYFENKKLFFIKWQDGMIKEGN